MIHDLISQSRPNLIRAKAVESRMLMKIFTGPVNLHNVAFRAVARVGWALRKALEVRNWLALAAGGGDVDTTKDDQIRLKAEKATPISEARRAKLYRPYICRASSGDLLPWVSMSAVPLLLIPTSY